MDEAMNYAELRQLAERRIATQTFDDLMQAEAKEILEVLDRLELLEGIVKDLAVTRPYGRGNYCSCGERFSAISHATSCPWRRAVEATR
jgi:hypothetical protein